MLTFKELLLLSPSLDSSTAGLLSASFLIAGFYAVVPSFYSSKAAIFTFIATFFFLASGLLLLWRAVSGSGAYLTISEVVGGATIAEVLRDFGSSTGWLLRDYFSLTTCSVSSVRYFITLVMAASNSS